MTERSQCEEQGRGGLPMAAAWGTGKGSGETAEDKEDRPAVEESNGPHYIW